MNEAMVYIPENCDEQKTTLMSLKEVIFLMRETKYF